MSPFSFLETQHRIKLMFGVIGVRAYGKTTNIMSPIQVSIWDCINPKYWSVFGIPSISNADDLVDSDSRSKLRLKLTGFEIENRLTRIETKRLAFQLVVDHCSSVPLTICGFRLQLRNSQQLDLTIQMSYYLFVDSTNYSGFSKYSCGYLKIAYF